MFYMSSVAASDVFVANKHPSLGVWASQVFLLRQQGKGNSVPVQDVVLVMNMMLILHHSQHLSNENTNLKNKNRIWSTEV